MNTEMREKIADILFECEYNTLGRVEQNKIEEILALIPPTLNEEEIENLFSENFSLKEMADLGCSGMYITYQKYKDLIQFLSGKIGKEGEYEALLKETIRELKIINQAENNPLINSLIAMLAQKIGGEIKNTQAHHPDYSKPKEKK